MEEYPKCPECGTDECSKLQQDVVSVDQKCCICDPDGETCSFCSSMM